MCSHAQSIFVYVGLRGGALLSTLYTYAQHGDPEVKGLVKHILNQVPCAVHLYVHVHEHVHVHVCNGIHIQVLHKSSAVYPGVWKH